MAIITRIQESLKVDLEEAEKILEKAIAGGEINDEFSENDWFEKRFLPNCVFIDEDGYAKMCIDALKILKTTAATDYGGSRQRDLGQLWADMTRGYLGELAFSIFMKEKWCVECDLGHEQGALADFLHLDIHKVRRSQQAWVKPKLKLGIKTTKWNGIWLDIPGDQFNHSDLHVLIKVGVGRDHLFSFFKKISVFKDKVLKKGEEVGSLTREESQIIFDSIPSFKLIPAYICGFAKKTDTFDVLSYGGKKGRFHYKIKSWKGPITGGDLEIIRKREELLVQGKVEFEGIQRFTHDSGYLFNAGNLHWSQEEWRHIFESI